MSLPLRGLLRSRGPLKVSEGPSENVIFAPIYAGFAEKSVRLNSPRFNSRALSSLAQDSFLAGGQTNYVERMHQSWCKDRSSVHASWAAYFENLEADVPSEQSFVTPPPSSASSRIQIPRKPVEDRAHPLANAVSQSTHDTSRLIQMIRGYQTRGHELANIDPLGLPKRYPIVSQARAQTPSPMGPGYFGFTEADMERVFDCRTQGMSGFLSPDCPAMTLREMVGRLEAVYCGSVGVEYMHISDSHVCNFIRQKLETYHPFQYSHELKRRILTRTARAQLFENFCHQKFSTSKRFGLDGAETLIVGMKAISKKGVVEGMDSVVVGMSHRGRLNVLENVMHKPMQQILSEFQGKTGFGNTGWGNTGDVKYHLGVEFDHTDKHSGKQLHMAILANPSHLETVLPVAIGQAKAQQYFSNDTHQSRVLPIIVHGDAALAGQGVVYETLQMSKLPCYSVGGTIHMVVNNQIGFTTNTGDACSGKYCTDLAKAVDAPVFHVNADDPEAVTFVSELALDYRQKFKSDVFIDIVGYRRFGHNELDMPKFTQPLMYNLVARHPPVLDLYSRKLIQQGVIDQEGVDKLKKEINTFYTTEYEKSKSFTPVSRSDYLPQWQHMAHPSTPCPPRATGVDEDLLKDLGRVISTLPPDFAAHPTIAKTFKARREAIETGQNLDFGLGETLCYASLLSDGFHVRLVGQDAERGTFSHRHAVVHDQNKFSKHNIFSGLNTPRDIQIRNSLLSEYAALGFETGYALEHPDTLCIWEAQFGDFANGAQVIIDQFIGSGEVKWNNQCGIVLMLPHGYDGQGPEHSSARLERYLQLCDDREDIIHPENWSVERTSVIQQHNLQVVNCTTPSNMFHVLRRQLHRGFRKPLVIMSPKKMLKMRVAYSPLKHFTSQTSFKRYIPDEAALKMPRNVQRLIVCSGQVYYDLAAYKERRGFDAVAIARVEQLSPFPFERFIEDCNSFPLLKSIVWAQEEPMNAGGWSYVSKRLCTALAHLGYPNGIRGPLYVGRDTNAAPAVGDARLHTEELNRLLHDAFNLDRLQNSYVEKYLPSC